MAKQFLSKLKMGLLLCDSSLTLRHVFQESRLSSTCKLALKCFMALLVIIAPNQKYADVLLKVNDG